MPLHIADSSINGTSLKHVPEKYVIFYSSVVDGQLWCPDCRVVDSLIKETFSPEDGPSALIVYVGTRQEWKTPSNIYRQAPWNVTGVPTIIKLKDGEPNRRLVDDEIKGKLGDFLDE